VTDCDGGKFWHISDLHLDYQYVEGGDSSQWCHTANQTDEAVGPAGNYSCDSPLLLVESSLQAMQRHQPSPDFILWTGDSAPHWRSPLPPDQKYITNVTKFVFTKLDQMFPGVPVVAALGNHDSSPPDQFPISENKSMPEYYHTLLSEGAFGDHLNTSGARETFLQCGYYSKSIQSASDLKLTFLVLNTNIYYHDDFNSASDTDPCGQLAWLDQSLQEVGHKEKVFIVAHVPPGSFERDPGKLNFNSPNETFKTINDRYIEIVSRPDNSPKISAHLYGHLHTDTFRILLDRATRATPVGVAFMAGSVTPILWVKNKVVGVNPTIRLMDFDSDNGILLDYSTYYLDLTSPFVQGKSDNEVEAKSERTNAKFLNSDKSKRSVEEVTEMNTTDSVYDLYWKPLYSAKETYKVDNLTAASMFNAFVHMVAEEEDIFSEYYKYNTGNNVDGNCDKSCVKNHLCAISNLVLKELTDCLKNNDSSIYYYYYGTRTPEGQNLTTIATAAAAAATTSKIANNNETGEEPTTPAEAITFKTTSPTNVSTGHNENDHSQDSVDDHDEQPPTSTEGDSTVVKEKIENSKSSSSDAVGIFFGILAIALAISLVIYGYRRYRNIRQRNQEFLLTDSVFRYDGYSHLDYD